MGAFPCGLIAKPHIGHHSEPERQVLPPRTLIGCRVPFSFHKGNKRVKGERRVRKKECISAMLLCFIVVLCA